MKILHMTSIFILVYFTRQVCSEDTFQCFQCRSDQDYGCLSNEMDEKNLKNCTLPPNYSGKVFCRKIHQILYFTEKRDEAIIRECGFDLDGFSKPSSGCYKTKWVVDSYQEFCDCTKTQCNTAVSSRHIQNSLFLILLLSCTCHLLINVS